MPREAVVGGLRAEAVTGASSPHGVRERIQARVPAFSIDLTEETLLLFPERLFGDVVGPISPEANDPNLRGGRGARTWRPTRPDRQARQDKHQRNPQEPHHG
jgi:hypothetical protein